METKMQNPNIIDISTSWDINNIEGYPILIKGAYLGDMVPETKIQVTEDEEDYSLSFLLKDRDQTYELIKDITTAISKALTYRYTHEYQPGKLLGAPCDDETYDISNAIDLLSVLDQIGTEID